MFDVVGKRNWFFALSALVTIPGLFFILATFFTGGKIGLQFAIDYTGGTVWVVRFADDAVSPDQVKSVMEARGLEAAVTRIGDGFVEIRTVPLGLSTAEPTPAPSVAPQAQRASMPPGAAFR